MATWQADFHFEVEASDLPGDYRERFGIVLPAGRSWSREIELWGSVDSDRIEVLRDSEGAPEVVCRFDLREWKPELYGRFLECVRAMGGRLRTPEGVAVAVEREPFENALRSSPAAQFVANPEAFLRTLRERT